MAIGISLIHLPIWTRIKQYLLIDYYARDRGHEEPRIRIGFVDLPESLGRELCFVEMPCVACQRPIHPLRRRVTDGFDRLFYAPTCPLSVRTACSRGRAAMLEYQRFAGIDSSKPTQQLSLL